MMALCEIIILYIMLISIENLTLSTQHQRKPVHITGGLQAADKMGKANSASAIDSGLSKC